MPFLPAGVGAAVAAGAASAAVGAGISALTKGSAGSAIQGGATQANQIAQNTIDEGRTNYGQDRAAYQPFVTQGTNGLAAYADLSGLNGPDAATAAMGNFSASPGYQYQLSEGLKAVDAGAAAKGMLRSGATIKAEQTLGSNLANQDFGAYLGRLNTLAQFGLSGAQGQAGSTSAFNNLLTGQSTNQQSTTTSAAGAQAAQYDAFGNVINQGAQSAIKNGLYEYNKATATPPGYATPTSTPGSLGYSGGGGSDGTYQDFTATYGKPP